MLHELKRKIGIQADNASLVPDDMSTPESDFRSAMDKRYMIGCHSIAQAIEVGNGSTNVKLNGDGKFYVPRSGLGAALWRRKRRIEGRMEVVDQWINKIFILPGATLTIKYPDRHFRCAIVEYRIGGKIRENHFLDLIEYKVTIACLYSKFIHTITKPLI